MAKYKSKKSIKMIVGYILIGLSLLLFALTVVPNFSCTNFFLGIFGLVWYVYLLLAFLFGIACILNLHYTYKTSFTIFLFVGVCSLICLLHTIFSTPALNSCNSFDSFGQYLHICYTSANGITIGGAFWGIIVYFFKTIFGIVGAYCVFIMLLAIFSGIVLDFCLTGNTKITIGSNQPIKINEVGNQIDQSYAEEMIKSNLHKELLTEQDEYQEIIESAPADLFDATIISNKVEPTTIEPQQNSAAKSARDILFGAKSLPEVTIGSDKERDQWMKNYREDENDSSLEDISDLFGGDISQNESTDLSDAYKRNFPSGSINLNTTDIDDSDNQDLFNRRIGGSNTQANLTEGISSEFVDGNSTQINNSRLNANQTLSADGSGISGRRLERTNTRNMFTDSKLGENAEDQAKPVSIDFNKPKPAVGKQMGIKSIIYNSIPLSVFRVYTEQNADYSAEYKRKTAALEKIMDDFKIGAKVINIVRGPKVTRYELTLPDGVSVSRVLNIETDISMAIEAKSKIRIEAPIPGKKAFGIELENDVCTTVGMRELLESPEFTRCKDPLPIAIGKDINGHVIIKSLPKMIHLLVAGSSGSGKSIFIHSLMMSILYKYSPDDVRFIMIDPKRVEFTMYNNLPHLMLPNVVYEHDKALNAIKWTVTEMMRRYDALQTNICQNIEQYNKLPEVTTGKQPKMPYLIIVVDELAELMSGALKKDFEANIQRITQLGRAAGIHMVVATQRPSVDVVTGTIKNNMPTRVAFALSSFADSKTVLDEGGAENLLGKGDMLFAPQDMNIKVRLQAAFCDNDEIKNAIKYVKDNNDVSYDDNVIHQIYDEKSNSGSDSSDTSLSGGSDMDEYIKLAIKFAQSTGKVSVSMLQRKFRIGFNRAARIVDQMVDLGLVGPSIGSKPRDFNITREQYEELFGPDDGDFDL